MCHTDCGNEVRQRDKLRRFYKADFHRLLVYYYEYKNDEHSIIELKHALKHIYGARLKFAGVSKEDRQICWVIRMGVNDICRA